MNAKSPHFWWIISIMALTIIALISFIISRRICCSDELMKYVSVASVILSITLSIFAIQYTYTSNNEIHQQFEKINSVADNIKETSEKLAKTNMLLNDNLNQILQRLENIDQSQKDMSSKIKNIMNAPVDTNISNTGNSSHK